MASIVDLTGGGAIMQQALQQQQPQQPQQQQQQQISFQLLWQQFIASWRPVYRAWQVQ
jgi:hypothetical protein